MHLGFELFYVLNQEIQVIVFVIGLFTVPFVWK